MNTQRYDSDKVEELARDCMEYVLLHGPDRESHFNSWLGRNMIRHVLEEYTRNGWIPEDLNSTDPLGVFERARQLLHEYAEEKSTNLERVAGIYDDRGFGVWYLGRHEFSQDQWEATRTRLQAEDFSDTALEALDRQTAAVMTRLGNPEESHNRRGLVIGDVQGGKTSHFTGLIASAVDAGYRLVVVLSGTTNSLRMQTQKRVSRHLVDARAHAWQPLTYLPGDGEPPSAGEFRRPGANPQNFAADQARSCPPAGGSWTAVLYRVSSSPNGRGAAQPYPGCRRTPRSADTSKRDGHRAARGRAARNSWAGTAVPDDPWEGSLDPGSAEFPVSGVARALARW